MEVAVVGCGFSGLSAIRRCIEMNINCVAFELSGEIGGLWVYNENVGADEFGIPIQTSLYHSMRTNSPKQLLELPDFKFVTEKDTCYPHHREVRRYLNQFAKHFKLLERIKFYYYVTKITRVLERKKWKVTVRNLKHQTEEEYYFDAVMICNGHTSKPFIPKIKGIENFQGLQMHSHDYRRKDIFRGKNVLVIGNGPSGIEIAAESAIVSEKVYLSQRNNDEIALNEKIMRKNNVKMIKGYDVTFSDDSTEKIDVIVYCTGYQYDFPFLDSTCGITIENGQIVNHLFKHYINIEETTMCFIGLFQRTIISYLFDLQIQAFLKFLTGSLELPSKEEMMKWLLNENIRKAKRKIPVNRYYHLSEDVEEYFNDICEYANLKNIPPVLFDIFRINEQTYAKNFSILRQLNFKIIDNHNYLYTVRDLSNEWKNSSKFHQLNQDNST